MSRRRSGIAIALLTINLLLPSVATAQAGSQSLCTNPPSVAFLYFNGVFRTLAQETQALKTVSTVYGATSPKNETINYELMYNFSMGVGSPADLLETFDQRLNEHGTVLANRFELFFEALTGGGEWTDRITAAIPAFANTLRAYGDYYLAKQVSWLTSLRNTSHTIDDYAAHKARIDSSVLKGSKLLLYAHSQGNLFANPAYDYAATKVPASSVALIHVAPASPVVHGPWVLADKDLVINGLRTLGSVPAVTGSIPEFSARPAGIVIPPGNGKDWLGHGLFEIYLNTSLSIGTSVASQDLKGLVTTALNTLAAPPARATNGFFNVTLNWNGSGDVDLHTFEPAGSHVFYSNRQGLAGFLDVDNTVANGPEHYYASCDPLKLQTGTYLVGVNNFNAPNGRIATLQVDSFFSGVLATKSVTLGSARGTSGDASPTTVLRVQVSRNATTGVYSVSAN